MQETKVLPKKIPIKINPYLLTIAILILVIILSLSGRRSYDATFEAYMDAYANRDAEGIVALMPKEYIESLRDDGRIESEEDLVYAIQQLLDHALHRYDDMELETYQYEVVHTQHAKKGDSNELMESFERIYGDSARKIKEVYAFGVDAVVEMEWVDGGTREDYLPRKYVYLVKIGQSWYIGAMDDLEYYT